MKGLNALQAKKNELKNKVIKTNVASPQGGTMKNLKEILAVLFGLQAAFEQAKADDGKIGLSDIGFFVPPLLLIPPAIEDAKVALDEWKNADDAARADIKTYVIEEFDLEDDKLEAKIEAGLKAFVELGAVFRGEVEETAPEAPAADA